MAYYLSMLLKTFTMKKLTLIAVMLFAIQIGKAQTPNDQALGIRFGGGDGVEAEISFQTFIGGNNRLEFDLGFEDPHRLTQRAGRVRQLLGTEEQHEHGYND